MESVQFVDANGPDGTVAWSSGLSPSIGRNETVESGQQSGESMRMAVHRREAFVVGQPYEDGGET